MTDGSAVSRMCPQNSQRLEDLRAVAEDSADMFRHVQTCSNAGNTEIKDLLAGCVADNMCPGSVVCIKR